MWLLGTRNWVILKDFKYTLNGTEYVILKGLHFDGASIFKFLRTFFSICWRVTNGWSCT